MCVASDSQSAVFVAFYQEDAVTYDTQTQVYGNVFDGSDNKIYSGSTCGAVPGGERVGAALYGTVPFIYNNYLGHLSNGYIGGPDVAIHDNVFEDIETSPNDVNDHENGLKSYTDCNVLIYNNVFKNFPYYGMELVSLYPGAGCTDHVFNNVSWNQTVGNGFQCQEQSTGTCTWFNNTEACGAAGTLTNTCGRSSGTETAHFINDHFITSASSWIDGSAYTTTTDVIQNESTATGQGYTASQTYVYSPTSATNATVGSGTNEYNVLCTAVAALNAAAGVACSNDTTYAVTYNTSNHTTSYPARTPIARPLSGAWDVGAYQFSAIAAGQPKPPTGLSAIVN